jgi:hypothetical protein
MTIRTIVSGVGAFAGLLAAYWWFQASQVGVPDNLDTFIGALQTASKMNGFAAGASVVGALCAVFLFARQAIGPKEDEA